MLAEQGRCTTGRRVAGGMMPARFGTGAGPDKPGWSSQLPVFSAFALGCSEEIGVIVQNPHARCRHRSDRRTNICMFFCDIAWLIVGMRMSAC